MVVLWSITISESVSDWHELMVQQSIYRLFIAQAHGQLEPQCSMQSYHCHSQLH